MLPSTEGSCRNISTPIGTPSRTDFIERRVKKCCANILTIIESSFGDPVQREAAKELVKKEFNRTLDDCRGEYSVGS